MCLSTLRSIQYVVFTPTKSTEPFLSTYLLSLRVEVIPTSFILSLTHHRYSKLYYSNFLYIDVIKESLGSKNCNEFIYFNLFT